MGIKGTTGYPSLQADGDALQRAEQVVRVDLRLVLARGHDRALVEQVGEVSPRHT